MPLIKAYDPNSEVASEIQEFVAEVGKQIGRNPDEVAPYAELLENNWFDTIGSLEGIPHEELTALGIPLRLARGIVASVAVLQQAASAAPMTDNEHGKAAHAPDAASGHKSGIAGGKDSRHKSGGKGAGGKGKDAGSAKGKEYGSGKGKEAGSGKGKDAGSVKGKDAGSGKGKEAGSSKGKEAGGGKGKGRRKNDAGVYNAFTQQPSPERKAGKHGGGHLDREERDGTSSVQKEYARWFDKREPSGERKGDNGSSRNRGGKGAILRGAKGIPSIGGEGESEANNGRDWQPRDGKQSVCFICKGNHLVRNCPAKKFEHTVPIEEPPDGYPAVSRLQGSEGRNIKHIREQSGALVWLNGEGSGHKSSDSSVNEPLHFKIVSTDYHKVENAVDMVNDLLTTVYKEWKSWPDEEARRPRHGGRREALRRDGPEARGGTRSGRPRRYDSDRSYQHSSSSQQHASSRHPLKRPRRS